MGHEVRIDYKNDNPTSQDDESTFTYKHCHPQYKGAMNICVSFQTAELKRCLTYLYALRKSTPSDSKYLPAINAEITADQAMLKREYGCDFPDEPTKTEVEYESITHALGLANQKIHALEQQNSALSGELKDNRTRLDTLEANAQKKPKKNCNII